MSRTQIRIDFAIPMVIAFGVGALVNFGGGKVLDSMEEKTKEVVYSDSQIGAAPTENVPVVSSIEEMMEEDYFTFHVTDDLVVNNSAYYDGTVYNLYELESGEQVVVDEYYLHSYYDHDDSDSSWWPDTYQVLPIGKVVQKPLPDELIDKFSENGYTITDTSFYVDMRGKFKDFSRDTYETKLEILSFLVGFIVFLGIRYVLIASGIFPPLFPLRFLRKWKKYIIYYGIIYYDENIEQILAYRKQGKYEEAAVEFAKLTNAPIIQAREAMNIWDDLYGEGIMHFSSPTS